MTTTAWAKFKENLSSRAPWLAPIAPEFYQLLRKAIQDNKIAPINCNPLLVEPLAQDIAKLLDRGLSYRRDAQDLEILAVKAAADYLKFTELLPLQRQYEIDSLGIEQLRLEKTAATLSAEKFGAGVGALEAGFAQEASGRITTLGKAISTAEGQEKRIIAKWSVTESYEKSSYTRLVEPDNSHNYVQRMGKIIRFLAEDLQEAHMKLQALACGMQIVFQKKFVVPPIDSNTVLDDFVLLSREISRHLESELSRDTRYELTIPLCQPWLVRQGRAYPLVDQRELILKVTTGKPLQFDLSPVFENQSRVRLRSVGLSFGNTVWDQNDPGRVHEMSSYRLRAVLSLPSINSDGAEVPRLPLVLGGISVFAGSAPLSIASGAACYNANPCGSWSIEFGQRAVHSLGKETLLTALLYDLKLHVDVVCQIDTGKRFTFPS